MNFIKTYFVLFVLDIKYLFDNILNFNKNLSDDDVFRDTFNKVVVKKNPCLRYVVKEHKYVGNSLNKIGVRRGSYCEAELKAYRAELKRLERISKRKFEAFKNHIAERQGENSEIYKILNSISHKKLVQLFFEFEKNSELDLYSFELSFDLKDFLSKTYNDYIRLKFLSDRISVLSKITKFFKTKLILYIRDRRILFRKLFSFLFKNLDDYHSVFIIQIVQFVVFIKLPVLILSNKTSERKHYKQNKRSFGFG